MMTAIAMVAMITTTSAQTASDHYLDMANYATIGAGDPTKIDNIYNTPKSQIPPTHGSQCLSMAQYLEGEIVIGWKLQMDLMLN